MPPASSSAKVPPCLPSQSVVTLLFPNRGTIASPLKTPFLKAYKTVLLWPGHRSVLLCRQAGTRASYKTDG